MKPMNNEIIILTMLLPMLECATYCDSKINMCFFTINDFSTNLIDAQDICAGNKGVLLKIYSQDYQNAVVNAFKNLGLGNESKFCWLNLKYVNGVYKWQTDDTVATYTKWNENQVAYTETTFLISTVYPYNWYFDRDVSDMFHPVMCMKNTEKQQIPTTLTTATSTTTISTSTGSALPTSVSTSTLATSVTTSIKSTLPISVSIIPFPTTSTSATNTTTISTLTITSNGIPTDPSSSTITTPTTTISSNGIPAVLNNFTSITAETTTSTDGVTIEPISITAIFPTTAKVILLNSGSSKSETPVDKIDDPSEKLPAAGIGIITIITVLASVVLIIVVFTLVYLFLLRPNKNKQKKSEVGQNRDPIQPYRIFSILSKDVTSGVNSIACNLPTEHDSNIIENTNNRIADANESNEDEQPYGNENSRREIIKAKEKSKNVKNYANKKNVNRIGNVIEDSES